MKTTNKKFAVMTNSGASIIEAKSKKEAATKLSVKVSQIYKYN